MFESLFGQSSGAIGGFVFVFFAVLALIGGITWLVRRFGMNRLGGAAARGRQPRLAVIDSAPVDSRRRLLLIRRDNVEHLLMIGGPTDVVVEQSIVRAQSQAREAPQSRGAGTPEALPRPIPLDDSVSWPLQPQAEPAPLRPQSEVTPHRTPRTAAMDESASWQTAPQPEPLPRVVRPLQPPPPPEEFSRWQQAQQPAPVPQNDPPVRMPRLATGGAVEPILRAQAARPEAGARPEPVLQMPRSIPPVEAPIARAPQQPPPAPPPQAREARAPVFVPPPPATAPAPIQAEPRADNDSAEPEFHTELIADNNAPPVQEPVDNEASHTPTPVSPIFPETSRPVVEAVAAEDTPPPQPARKPAAETALSPEADENLAEMALRLEAALRGPVASAGNADRQPPPVQHHPAEAPDHALTAVAPSESDIAAEEPPAPAKPKAGGRTLYANLEEEMASLLGRPAAGNKG